MFIAVALFGWPIIAIVLFSLMRPRHAAMATIIGGTLFLPMMGFQVWDIIPWNKSTSTAFSVILGIVIFDLRAVWNYRFKWIDAAMIVWCLVPGASMLANGLGATSAASPMFQQCMLWGVPYFAGRLYIRSLSDVRELAIALFIGGLVYVPFCLFEVRMSPQLHTMVYGEHQHSFIQTKRAGGWRPTVFMQHGLMVGMWMCMTALIGLWLWYSRAVSRRWMHVGTIWYVAALVVTAVLCKSFGAVLLLFVGGAVLWASVALRTRSIIWLIVVALVCYIGLRGTRLWDGAELVQWARELAGDERAGSLSTRINTENVLAQNARERLFMGWGGWGRGRDIGDTGQRWGVTDGYWIIVFGYYGLVGVGAWLLSMLLPCVRALRYVPVADWVKPGTAAPVCLAFVGVLFVIDSVPNAMINPIYTLVAGGLAGAALLPPRVAATFQARQEIGITVSSREV